MADACFTAGEWRYANGFGCYEFRNQLTHIEILGVYRTLGDNQVAIDRSVADQIADELSFGGRTALANAVSSAIQLRSR